MELKFLVRISSKDNTFNQVNELTSKEITSLKKDGFRVKFIKYPKNKEKINLNIKEISKWA